MPKTAEEDPMGARWLAWAAAVSLAVPAARAEGPGVKMLEKGVKACGPDIERFCRDAAPGEGRVGECLYRHRDRLSRPCREFARHGGPGHEQESLREIDLSAPAAAERAAAVVIDVRTPEEYAAGHLAGAVNIPHGEIGERIREVAPDRAAPIVLYCKSGRRAGIARETLLRLGYARVENAGGYEELRTRGKPPAR